MKFYFLVLSFFLALPRLYSAEAQFGHKKYVEYIPGDLPIIIAAPHGGRQTDDTIADRKSGVLLADKNTDKLARNIYESFKKSGKTPHLIICHLKRLKVDCNRSKDLACEGDKQALKVWEDFQGYIEKAKKSIRKKGKKVLFIDLHAHGHEIQRLELGYLLRAEDLRKKGKEFSSLQATSSVKDLVNEAAFDELIRGKKSLGTLLHSAGFPSVPSLEIKEPGKGNKFFRGGYNTMRHGAQKSKGCFAIQIECNKKGVRDSEKNRLKFGDALSRSLLIFYNSYFKN